MDLNIFEQLSITARNVIGITNVYTPQHYLAETFSVRNTVLKGFLSRNDAALGAVERIFKIISMLSDIGKFYKATGDHASLRMYTVETVDSIERLATTVMLAYDKTVKQYKDMEAWDELRDIHYWNLYLLKDQLYLHAKNGTDTSELDLYFPTLRESLRIINGDQSTFFEDFIGMKITFNVSSVRTDSNDKSYIDITYNKDHVLYGEFTTREPARLDTSFIYKA